jgi:hypothetical protein
MSKIRGVEKMKPIFKFQIPKYRTKFQIPKAKSLDTYPSSDKQHYTANCSKFCSRVDEAGFVSDN